MATKIQAAVIAAIRATSNIDSDNFIAKRDGSIDFKRSYFYRHGSTPQGHADNVERIMREAGWEADRVEAYDDFARWPKISFFHAIFKNFRQIPIDAPVGSAAVKVEERTFDTMTAHGDILGQQMTLELTPEQEQSASGMTALVEEINTAGEAVSDAVYDKVLASKGSLNLTRNPMGGYVYVNSIGVWFSIKLTDKQDWWIVRNVVAGTEEQCYDLKSVRARICN